MVTFSGKCRSDGDEPDTLTRYQQLPQEPGPDGLVEYMNALFVLTESDPDALQWAREDWKLTQDEFADVMKTEYHYLFEDYDKSFQFFFTDHPSVFEPLRKKEPVSLETCLPSNAHGLSIDSTRYDVARKLLNAAAREHDLIQLDDRPESCDWQSLYGAIWVHAKGQWKCLYAFPWTPFEEYACPG